MLSRELRHRARGRPRRPLHRTHSRLCEVLGGRTFRPRRARSYRVAGSPARTSRSEVDVRVTSQTPGLGSAGGPLRVPAGTRPAGPRQPGPAHEAAHYQLSGLMNLSLRPAGIDTTDGTRVRQPPHRAFGQSQQLPAWAVPSTPTSTWLSTNHRLSSLPS